MSDPANPQGKRWFGMAPVEWVLVVLVVSAIVACLLLMSAHDSSKLAYLTGFSDRAEEYSESLPNDEVRGAFLGFQPVLRNCFVYSELATRRGSLMPLSQAKETLRIEEGAAVFDACLRTYLNEIEPILGASAHSVFLTHLNCDAGCDLPALGRYGPWSSQPQG